MTDPRSELDRLRQLSADYNTAAACYGETNREGKWAECSMAFSRVSDAALDALPWLLALADEALAARERDAASEAYTVAENTPSEDFGPGETGIRVAIALADREYRRLQSDSQKLLAARSRTDAAWATRKDGTK